VTALGGFAADGTTGLAGAAVTGAGFDTPVLGELPSSSGVTFAGGKAGAGAGDFGVSSELSSASLSAAGFLAGN